MTKTLDVELTLREMLLSAKRYWGLVLVSAVVCAVVGGVLGYVRSTRTDVASETEVTEDTNTEETAEEQALIEHQNYILDSYEELSKIYDEAEEFNRVEAEKLREEWEYYRGQLESHPLALQDPATCDTVYLTVYFDPETGSHDYMLYDWIQEADADRLFGDAADTLSAVRTDVVRTDVVRTDAAKGLSARQSAESLITIYEVDGFDADDAVEYLKTYISEQANKYDIAIRGYSTSRITGYNKDVREFRSNLVSDMNSVYSTLSNMYTTSMTPVSQPLNPDGTVVGQVVENTVVDNTTSRYEVHKFILVGFLLGVVIGGILAVCITIKKGCILSSRQMEEDIGLELLGDFSKEDAVALDILNSNLDVMVGRDASVMMIGDDHGADRMRDSVYVWNANGDREFVVGRDIIEDFETIDNLSRVEGLVLAVKIGESKISDIQRTLIRADRLEKRILGYVRI